MPSVVCSPETPGVGTSCSVMMRTYAVGDGAGLKICDSRSTGRRRGAMADPDDARGILRPARLPTFHRVPAPAELQEAIRWFWIPRWQVAPGRTSRQH